MTNQMKAVLMLAEHPLVRDEVKQHVDVEREQVHFSKIDYRSLSSSGQILVSWMWCIWKDEQVPENNLEFPEKFRVDANGFVTGIKIIDPSHGFNFHLKNGMLDPFWTIKHLEPSVQILVFQAMACRLGLRVVGVHSA